MAKSSPRVLSLGQQVQRFRQFLDLTQAELADRMGVAENTVHLIERDTRSASDKCLASLSAVLKKTGVHGVTPSVLRLLSDPSDDPTVVKLRGIAEKLLDDQLAVRAKG